MNTYVDRFFLILRKIFACGAISGTKQPIWIRCAANYVKNILNNEVYTKILVKMYRENSNFGRRRRQKVIKINEKIGFALIFRKIFACGAIHGAKQHYLASLRSQICEEHTKQ